MSQNVNKVLVEVNLDQEHKQFPSCILLANIFPKLVSLLCVLLVVNSVE